MLGIIICGADQEGIFNEAVYHQFGDSTVFEYTLDSCLKSEQAQRVVVCAPASQRRNIKGGGIFNPLIRGDRSYLGRKALFHFYTDEADVISGLYFSALSYGLDHIALVHANCPILPAWLINTMIFEYMSTTDKNGFMYNHDPNKPSGWLYDKAFQVQIFPFWMLADQYLYAEDRSRLNLYEDDRYKKQFFANNKGEEWYLPTSTIDLRFTDLDRIEEFDFLLNELAKGADLGDLIEDLNEPQEVEE